MSNYPLGGDVPTTRAWLDAEGFTGCFDGWKADAILGLSEATIMKEVPNEKGEILWGFLNTARHSQQAGAGAAATAAATAASAGQQALPAQTGGTKRRRDAEDKYTQPGSVGSFVTTQWKEQFVFELSSVAVDVISEGKTESIPGEHLIVKKLPTLFSSRYGSIPESIYVRDSYKALYESAAQSQIRQHRGYSATLFTGVPGIGKSLFLVYFIYRFLTDTRFEDKRFALEFTKGKYYYFRPNGVYGDFWCSIEDALCMQSKHFLLLCDISDAVQPISRAKWTYIFSSPSPARYKEIIKNSPNKRYTLPTWSELELMFVSADIKSWYDDFVLFGGVPRSIFFNPVICSDPHILMADALERKGGALSESFFKYGFGIDDSLQNYMLVHINPPVTLGGEFAYDGMVVYTFASDLMFKRLAEKHSTQMLAGAVGMFNVGVASESYGAVSAGKLFEKVCLWLKPLDGMHLAATSMHDATQTHFVVPSVRQVLPPDWRKTALLVPNVLYVPRMSNLESGDSFFLVLLPTGGYLLVVLQITAGKSHPVKVNGLHDILLAYLHDVRAHVVSKALAFVLPKHGELDGVQAMITKKEEQIDSSRVPIAVREFKQYVYTHVI